MTITVERKTPWKANKFKAQPVVDPDYGRFDSKREHQRFHILRMMEKAGHIQGLKRQVPYELNVNGEHICKYIADFTYMDMTEGKGFVTEDCKGFRTPEYKLKAKLFKAIFGREILET